jgi:hypothetical protein
MGTDFFDDDLLESGGRSRDEVDESNGVPIRSITEVNLGRMAKQRRELTSQVSGAETEIERLRRRQEELEKEKEELQNLTRKQQGYERTKRELIERLERGIILAEKEQAQATRMSELLAETRSRFKETLAEIRGIKEDEWAEEEFQSELDRASVIVDNAAKTYRKALAQIDAASGGGSVVGKNVVEPFEEAPREAALPRSFSFWLKAGLAASLPLIVVLIVFFIAYLVFMGIIGF